MSVPVPKPVQLPACLLLVVDTKMRASSEVNVSGVANFPIPLAAWIKSGKVSHFDRLKHGGTVPRFGVWGQAGPPFLFLCEEELTYAFAFRRYFRRQGIRAVSRR